MTSPSKKFDLRLAMRVEGNWWVAYCAKRGTMDGAMEMGRIMIGVVLKPERKQAFIDLMTGAMSDFLLAVVGQRPNWTFTDAPEIERGGNA